jgi:hypothetical protein
MNSLPRRAGNLLQRTEIAARIDAGKPRIGPQIGKFPAKVPASRDFANDGLNPAGYGLNPAGY